MKSLLSSDPSLSLEGHRPYLYRYALSRVRHRETADEVVQDTLLAALEEKAKFRGNSSLRTWLVGILKHKVIDHHRREARTPVHVGELAAVDCDGFDAEVEDHFTADGEWITPPSSWPGPEQSYETACFWNTFEGCLAMLPSAVGRAFYLREIEGLSTDEICAKLGVTPNNCLVMLYRARMKLQQSMQERWLEPVARQ